jgi:hypothetical protein
LSGRVIYVKCASGSEDEDGSLANPYRTVAKAYSAAMPGDVIAIVGWCEYPEIITLRKSIVIRNECASVTIGPLGDSGP